MIYVSICICVILFIFLSYLFIKTYQLSGYNISSYLKNVFDLKLAYGDKNKLNFTKRIIRFYIFLTLFAFLLFFLVIFYIKNIYLKIFDCIVIFLCLPFCIALVHYLVLPIELLIKKYYIVKATKKLKNKKIIKIGITGSFGKTSTKNILKSLLEKKYKVCASPKNYNTEMGISKTILECLDDHEVFIAEMGARHKGDIKLVAQMVEPDYGIITTIGAQHLETFKSITTIEDTKFELAENLSQDGVMIFNGDSNSTKKLYDRFSGKKFLVCDKNGFSYAEDIKLTSEGSKFKFLIDGKIIDIETKLLGKCNIDNIVTAATVAYLLGVDIEEMQLAIKELEPTKHRLEIIKSSSCIVIDDSYNSNIIGCQEALDTLNMFSGKKIVITPGMVELGSEQSEMNFKYGAMIADVADYIIIMNNTNKNELLSGAISHNFKRENIFFAESRKKQKEILEKIVSKDCVVLFENDLPDNYK